MKTLNEQRLEDLVGRLREEENELTEEQKDYLANAIADCATADPEKREV